MTSKLKKTKASGRFGPRYGKKVRTALDSIETKQRVKQKCPYCSKEGIKRLSKGIWSCPKCGTKFSSDVYYIKA